MPKLKAKFPKMFRNRQKKAKITQGCRDVKYNDGSNTCDDKKK